MDFPLDPAFACAYSAAHRPWLVGTRPGSLIHDGALAQLGERLHGMQEVSGSIPLGSTIPLSYILQLLHCGNRGCKRASVSEHFSCNA